MVRSNDTEPVRMITFLYEELWSMNSKLEKIAVLSVDDIENVFRSLNAVKFLKKTAIGSSLRFPTIGKIVGIVVRIFLKKFSEVCIGLCPGRRLTLGI